jgi:hypothetical protein
MKSYLLLLIGSFLLSACSGEPKRAAIKHSFSYQGEYYPSFLPPCTISITAKGDVQRIWLSVYQYRDTVKTLAFTNSAALSSADLTFFFAKLDSVPVLKMVTKEQFGLDGITVYNTVLQDNIQNKFKFWSPRKGDASQEYKLVEAVLGLSRRKFTARKEQDYFKSLERYFD